MRMWRSFDVGAVVDSLIADAMVVAGRDGTLRQVDRARVIATPTEVGRAAAGDLLVTTVDLLESAGASWEQLLSQLDAARVAGLAFRLDASEPVPGELLAVADQLSLPVIAFPRATGLADVANAVLDALLQAQRERLERFVDIHQRFVPIVLAGGGAAEIAEALHSLLKCPIAVVDADGRELVKIPSATGGDFASESAARQPVDAGEHHYGEIIALPRDGHLDHDAHLALQRASLALAVRMAHSSAAAAEQERFASISLEELIAGHGGDIADVAERANSFGWDLQRPRAVLLASIDPPPRTESLPRTLATIAAAARATLGPDAIVWSRSTTIAALLAPETASPSDRRALAERLRVELDGRVRAETISIGVGTCVDAPHELPRSYAEATRAVEVGRWAKGRHATEIFDELGLERLLASTPSTDLAEFVQHSIGSLLDHDRTQGTDLVETLAVWLETRNMAEAARRIHVHYNTFKNRLDRIESILGPVVADSAKSLECEVAIYVYRHYDGPWSLSASDGQSSPQQRHR